MSLKSARLELLQNLRDAGVTDPDEIDRYLMGEVQLPVTVDEPLVKKG